MVKKAIGPLCDKKSLQEILNLKVCDPAMGSGHFLIGTIKYLEERALDAIYQNESEPIVDRENLRWQILHNCIYGADLNPLAVELSKFSLWIYTVFKNHELEPLSDQLKTGDSLFSPEIVENGLSWNKAYPEVKQAGGFDAIVGNPPYVARKNSDYVGKLGGIDGQGDLYLAFLNRALEDDGIPLKKGGYLTFIIPDPMLIRGNAKALRKKITSSHKLVSCMHINGVFDAGVSNIVLLIQRGVKSKEHETHFCRIDNKDLRSEFEAKIEIPKTAFSNSIPQSAFLTDEDCAWTYLLESSDLATLSVMKAGGKNLGDYYEDRRGEETSKKAIRDNAARGGRNMLIGGEGIKPFEIEQEAIVQVKSTFVKKNSEFYRPMKVILQKSSPRFVCAVDSGSIDKDGIVVPQSVYILHSKDEKPVLDCWFVAALLNSRLANDYLFKGTTGYKILQPHFEQKDIKGFPIFDTAKFDQTKIESEKAKIYKELNKSNGKVPEYGTTKEANVAAISAISKFLHEVKGMDKDGGMSKKLIAEIESALLRIYKACNVQRSAA